MGGHGLVVKHTLAMGEPGVRFSLPAPNIAREDRESKLLCFRGESKAGGIFEFEARLVLAERREYRGGVARNLRQRIYL